MDIVITYGTVRTTFDEIKEQIANQFYYAYYSALPTDSLIEDDNHHGVPRMNEVFYSMFIRHNHIPSWTAFLDEYKRRWCYYVGHDGEMGWKSPLPRYNYRFQEAALDKKLIRAYMSFLKEVYVLFWFYHIGMTDAYWSLSNDMSGYDIVMPNAFGRIYGIKIYSNTANARRFARIKTTSRNHLLQGSTSVSIQAPIGRNGLRLGDTYLFTDKLLLGVYNYIMNNIRRDIII